MKYIFEHIIETRVIFKTIGEGAQNQAEKKYISALLKDIFHHKLVDLVLDELNEENKLAFLELVDDEEKHLSTIDKLKEWIEDFEGKLASRIEETERELMGILRV